jgi:hypothetical protein
MLSALATSVGALMQFYFGSSAGSAAKNEMMDRLMRNMGGNRASSNS